MPETVEQLKEWFIQLWPAGLQPYALFIIAIIAGLSAIIATLIPFFEATKRWRKKADVSAPIEQYRGNLIAKFKQAIDSIDALIGGAKASHALYSRDPVVFLESFKNHTIDVRARAFTALDAGDLVTAHEVINELKNTVADCKAEFAEYKELMRRMATMKNSPFHDVRHFCDKLAQCLEPITFDETAS